MIKILEPQGTAGNGEKTTEELFQQYLLVARCWNDHKLAVSHGMSVEKAMLLLRQVILDTAKRTRGQKLRTRAQQLMHDIIYIQEEPQHPPIAEISAS